MSEKGFMKAVLPFILIWNLISAILMIFASMRSSQLSQQEEAQQVGYVEVG